MAKKQKAAKKSPGKSAGKKEKYATLHDLLVLKLQSLYDIEGKLVKALPKMARAAVHPDLRAAFEEHGLQTGHQAERLRETLELLGAPMRAEQVAAIRGLIQDAEWVIKSVRDPGARDAILIAAAQYVERYESAGYASAREWAAMLGYDRVEELLRRTLEEEELAYIKLAELAHTGINQKAGGIPMEDREPTAEELEILM